MEGLRVALRSLTIAFGNRSTVRVLVTLSYRSLHIGPSLSFFFVSLESIEIRKRSNGRQKRARDVIYISTRQKLDCTVTAKWTPKPTRALSISFQSHRNLQKTIPFHAILLYVILLLYFNLIDHLIKDGAKEGDRTNSTHRGALSISAPLTFYSVHVRF